MSFLKKAGKGLAKGLGGSRQRSGSHDSDGVVSATAASGVAAPLSPSGWLGESEAGAITPPAALTPTREGEAVVFRDLSIELGQLELTKGPGTEFALEDAPSISIRCQGIKNECHTITEDVSKTEGVLHFNYKEKMMVPRARLSSKLGGYRLKCEVLLPISGSSPLVASKDLIVGDDEVMGHPMQVLLELPDAIACTVALTLAISAGPRVEEIPDLLSDMPANIIFVTILSAKVESKEKDGADCYAELSSGKWSARTSKCSNDNSPVWNQRFAIPVVKQRDGTCPLKLKILDHNKLLKDVHLGEVLINLLSPPLSGVEAVGQTMFRELTLVPEGKASLVPNSPFPVGSVKLKYQPTYVGEIVDMKRYAQGQTDLDVNDGTANDDDDVEDGDEETPEERAKREEDAKKAQEAQEAEIKRLEGIIVKEGNYTFMVHIIEVRDLKAEDASGLNDPVVYIDCFNKIQHSKIKRNCNSAVFDDLFHFELPNMRRDDLEGGVIRVNVMDADVTFNDCIGTFQTDFDSVYYRNDQHELYRQWVPLIDQSESGDSGVQGYLLLSITILGPGDKPPAHDRKAEIEEEQRLLAEGKDTASSFLPIMTQRLHFLVLTIYGALDVPPTDQGLLTKPSIDAFVQVKFGYSDPVRTKIVTVKSQSSSGGLLTIMWNVRIWMPIMVPSLSDRIEITLWDKDLIGKDEIVGVCSIFDYGMVANGVHVRPFWANMYGATYPCNKPMYDTKEARRQCRSPSIATYYRGRLLISMEQDKNDGRKKRRQKVYVKSLKDAAPHLPDMSEYDIRAVVYTGNDLPSKQKLSVRVQIGRFYAQTLKVKPEKSMPGVVRWNEVLTVGGHEATKLPSNPRMIPDVFVYLVKNDENIAYHRLSIRDILHEGFEGQPQWLRLHRDTVIKDIKPDEYPGSLLLKIGAAIKGESNVHWVAPSEMSDVPFRLIAYIYQGRELCPADDSGLLDPYVVVRFNGIAQKTIKLKQTRNPSYFQSLVFDTMLPRDISLWPEITVEVWDWDKGLDPDDWVGSVRIPAAHVKDRCTTKTYSLGRRLRKPKWYSLEFHTPGSGQGEVLLNFEMIERASEEESFPSPRVIEPEMAEYIVEVIPIGLRDLRPKGPIPLSKPYVELSVGDDAEVTRTTASRLPSVSNPNFRPEEVKISCMLPADPMFAPALNVAVLDKKLGGLSKVLIGTATIPLGPRIKGHPLYRPPGGLPFAGGEDSNPFIDEPRLKESAPERVMGHMPGAASGDSSSPVPALQAAVEAAFSSAHSVDEKEGHDHSQHVVQEDETLSKYMIGREVTNDELEWNLGPTPFEEYPVFRGMKRPSSEGGLEGGFARVGSFKGIVRVYRANENPDPPPFDTKSLLRPAGCIVRVYVLKGYQLKAMDKRENNSDPYIKLKLGDQVISDRANFQKNVSNNAKFYKSFEMQAKFPGSSKLEVMVMDWDAIGQDNLVGKTIVDLEDRWFSKDWNEMIWDRCGHGDGPRLLTPVERRDLWSPVSTNPQGTLEMWIDLIPTSQVGKHPLIDISLPPPMEYELRFIIYSVDEWEEPGDFFSGLTDMFIKAKLGANGRWQETDTHLRAQSRASFNWRMRFPVKLPVDADEEGATGFLLQIFDADVFYNDMLCEESFNFDAFFRRAYKSKLPTSYFPRQSDTKLHDLNTAGVGFEPKKTLLALSPMLSPALSPVAASMMSGMFGVGAGAGAKDIEGGLGEKQPLLAGEERAGGAAAKSAPLVRRRSNDENDPNMKGKKKKITMWQQVKGALGAGPPPDHSGYIAVHKTVRKKDGTSKRVKIGRMLVSMELLPMEDARQKPAGFGRSEPNTNPPMPDPEGRPDPLKMLNPLYALKVCLGEGLLMKFCGVFCCLGLFASFIFVGPTVFDLLDIAMRFPFGPILSAAVLACFCLGCLYSATTCGVLCGCCERNAGADRDEDGEEEEV